MQNGRWTSRTGARRQGVAALLLGSLLLAGGAANAQTHTPAPRYAVFNLGTLSQGNVSIVRGPNGTGEGVGAGTVAGRPSGARRGLLFRWGAAAESLAGLSGGDDTTVFGVNDAGGFVGASKALVDGNPRPSLDQVREALAGHLCRCGTYPRLRRAAARAVEIGGRR